jgi:diguanylate cyclase (GGDEF)-like protein
VQTKGKPLGVILAETNEYRTTKETHGNAVADGLLKTIADRVGALIGSQDLVGRYEDDRMLLLLPDKGRDEVIEIAQGIRSVVEAGPVTIQGVRIPVRLSIGATVVTGQNRIALETAILAAENALADAKQGASATVGFAAIKASSIPAPAVETPKPSPASKLDLELIVAARAGNVKRVKGLLHSGANVDARDNRGNTALIEAAFFKYPDLVKLLLDSGADIDAGNNAGDTALTEAVRAGHDEVVNLLLSKWNPSSLEGESTPLYRALVETSSYGNTDVVTTVRDYLSRHGYGKQT